MSYVSKHDTRDRRAFERRLRHKFGLTDAVLRALGELHYPGKP